MIIFLLYSIIQCNFLTDIFSDDNMKTSRLTDATKYGRAVSGIDPALDSLLTTNWIVIGKRTCPFTQKAMTLLRNQGEEYIFLDKEDSLKKVYEKLKTILNHDTIPLVINKGKFIGGYTQTLEYFQKKDVEVTEMQKGSVEDQLAKDYYKELVDTMRKRDEWIERSI